MGKHRAGEPCGGSTISKAMGHDSEKTTIIYLQSLDTSSVDNANSDIIRMIYGRKRKL